MNNLKIYEFFISPSRSSLCDWVHTCLTLVGRKEEVVKCVTWSWMKNTQKTFRGKMSTTNYKQGFLTNICVTWKHDICIIYYYSQERAPCVAPASIPCERWESRLRWRWRWGGELCCSLLHHCVCVWETDGELRCASRQPTLTGSERDSNRPPLQNPRRPQTPGAQTLPPIRRAQLHACRPIKLQSEK